MWSNFYAAGGWGMHPTTIFGFLMIASCVLYALKPQKKVMRLAITLGLLTLAAGLLGTFTGICNSAFYIQKVAKADQVEILALGVEESLHNAILSLILFVVGGLIGGVGIVRENGVPAKAAA